MQVFEDNVGICDCRHSCRLIDALRQRNSLLELFVLIGLPSFGCELVKCIDHLEFASQRRAMRCRVGRRVADIDTIENLRFATLFGISADDRDRIALLNAFVLPNLVAILIGQTINVYAVIAVNHVESA